MAMTPTPQQQAVIDWARTGYGSCNVQALAGTGKCLGRGTPVIKFDGTIIPVESIKPNDLLMGPDSTPRQVESVSRGVGPLYRITPIKGDSWICNDAHIMTLMGTNNKSGVIIDTPLSECLKRPDANGRLDKQWKLFRVPLSFTESEIPYDAYMIGSWLGDGTIHEPLWTLGLKKESILKYLSDLAPTMNFRPVVKWDDRTNTWNILYRIRFHGEKGRVRYEKHPFKSYINEHLMIEGEKRIPRCYLMNTNVVRKSIFAGLMDTDGHQSSPTTFDFVTKYKGLSEDVLFLSRSLGLAAYCTEKQVKLEAWSEPRVYYRISISGSFESYPFLRHSINARQQVKDVLKTGWAAEPIGVGEYFGFTLSGDGRFLLGDFTVTHNTSLLMMIAAVISGKALFCAFNKAIAEELKSRLLPYPHCEGATLHSVGLRLFRKLRTKFEVESRKVRFIARDVVGPYNKKAVDVVVAAVDSAKQTGVGIPGYPHWGDEQTWMDIFDADEDLTDELPSDFSLTRAYESCKQVYKKSMAMCEDKQAVIDFNDMLLAPLVMGGTGSWMESYDWVLCDEGQDLNETRRLLASRVLRKGGRFVLVGDSHQAIYGFSGADSNSMELMKKALNYEQEFPLSVTYRCPKSVVELSHQWVPDYEAAEQNQEGVIRTIQHDQFWKEDFSPDDVVICRNTRPLVGIAKRLRKANIPCIVEGYSPKGLIAMAEKWGDITIEGFISKVTDYRDAECEKLERKKKEEKAEALRDKVSVLLELCEDLNPDDGIRSLVSLIEKLFGQGQNGEDLDVLHLCTIHRVKGREFDRVYLVGRNAYMPSYWATKSGDPEALQQEENLQYVAVTRTKEELVEVLVPVKKRGSEGPDWWEV
jgi:DNA helicase II / ATP-dependent DNA helicase PcrA